MTELHLLDATGRTTACGLPLTGLVHATSQSFGEAEGHSKCRSCLYAFVTPCKGGCGRRLRWNERDGDGLCWRCAARKVEPADNDKAGYSIYKNRIAGVATIHRASCEQVRRSGRARNTGIRVAGWYVDDLSTMEEAERAAWGVGWETRRCNLCHP